MNSLIVLRSIAAAAVVVCCHTIANAQTVISAQSGAWSAPATWAGGVVPGNGSTVVISNTHTVTADYTAAPASVTVCPTGALTLNDNAVVLNATALVDSGTVTVSSALTGASRLIAATFTIASGGSFTNSAGNATAVAITNFNVNGTGTYTHNAVGSVTDGAATDFPGSAITLSSASNVVITKWATDASTAPAALPTTAWGHLNINVSNNYNGSWQQGGALNNVAGNLTLTNTGTGSSGNDFRFNTETASSTVTIQGNFNVDIPTSNTINLSRGGTSNFSTITFNVNGNFNQTNGVINLGATWTTTTFNVSGNFTCSGGQFTRGNQSGTNITLKKASGTQYFSQWASAFSTTPIKFNFGTGATSQTVELSTDFYMPTSSNVVIATGCTVNAGSTVFTTDGSITVNGTFNSQAHVNPGLGFTISATGTMNYSTGTVTMKTNNTFLVNGVLNLGSGTISLGNGAAIFGTMTIGATGVADLSNGLVTQSFASKFTATNGCTIKIGSPDGITTKPTMAGNVQTTNTRVFNTGVNYVYNGSTNQNTGTGLPATVKTLTIANTGSSGDNTVTLTNSGTLTVSNVANSLVLTSGTLVIGSGNTVSIPDGGTVTATSGNISSTSSGGTVSFAGVGTVSATGTLNFYNVTLASAASSKGVDFGSTGTPTVYGTLQVNTNRYVNTNYPAYAATSTLQYNEGGSVARTIEWSSTSGRGYPGNVRVSNNTTFDLANGDLNTLRQLAGSLTIDAGSTLSMNVGGGMTQPLKGLGGATIAGTLILSSASGGDLYVGGAWSRTGTFTHNNRNVYLNGSSNQTLAATGGESFYNLHIDNAAGITLSNDVTVSNTLNLINGPITTSSHRVVVSNSSYDALVGDPGNVNYTSGWINGNLRRYMATNSSTYDFPVGNGASRLMQFVNDNSTGITYLDASFGAKPGNDVGLVAAETMDGNQSSYMCVLNNGVWYLTPDGGYGSGAAYTLRLFLNGFNGLINNGFAILRRNDASSSAADWIPPVGSWTPNENMPGRTVASGYAERNNVTTFSQYGVGMTGFPLPLKLVAFTGEHASVGNRLYWTTNSEMNTNRFEIERSTDGISFETIGETPAAGFSTFELDYGFTDAAPSAGINYYRLRMIDNDETFTYSNIVALNGGKTNAVVNVFPNPASNELYVSVSGETSQCFARVVDAMGRTVMTDQSCAGQTLKLELDRLVPGNYCLVLLDESNGSVSNARFVKTR